MEVVMDGFMSKLINASQEKRGASGAIVAGDWSKYQWGVKMPHLMMEYMFGLNVIPYPAIIEIAGTPGSCKSAFLQYLLRVYAEQAFSACMIETEGKMSNTLLTSILEDYEKGVVLYPGVTNQEAWQSIMTTILREYRKYYVATLKDYNKGKGELAKPLLIELDSLGAAPSIDSISAINKEGAAGRAFPVEALKNSKYFAQLPSRIIDLPVTIIYSNHEMKAIEQTPSFGFGGAKERTTKGGATPDFFAGIRLFFEQLSKPTEVKKGTFQQNLSVECYKNSFNQKGNKITLTMEWDVSVDPETNRAVQKTRFLWGKSLVNYLAPSAGGFKYDREAVKKFLCVVHNSDVKYSCKELDVKDENPEVLGNLIESCPALVEQLRPYMGIKQWNVYDGTPFSRSVKETADVEEEGEE